MKDKQPRLKKLPALRSDAEAKDFVENVDLSRYDVGEMQRFNFEFQKKEARVNMRLPNSLLSAVKTEAGKRGIPYQRFIRQAIEQAVAPKNRKLWKLTTEDRLSMAAGARNQDDTATAPPGRF